MRAKLGAGFDRSAARSELAQPGKVHLVGAGPGDPELLTIRAARLIAAADVILHDELVTAEILAIAHPGARLVNVGKRSGAPSTGQDHIHRLLVEAARSGAMVVRLKGGDPFIFGRGGEEQDYLQQAGIEVVVVPGITAALGCAAEAGIPLTFRGEATRVSFVTANTADGPDAVDWSLSGDPQTSVVIYMGLSAATAVRDGLIAAGRDAGTPAAVLARGTRADARSAFGRLSDLPALARAVGEGPALLVIGDVVARSRAWQAETTHIEAAA